MLFDCLQTSQAHVNLFWKLNNQLQATLFDYVVDKNGEWELWSNRVTNYIYPEYSTPDYASILIPIPDNVRIDFLINTIVKQQKPVLLIGEQGTAKTVMMKSYMRKANPEMYLIRSCNFSSATSPYQFQKTIESYVEKRMGNTFGPPNGKKMIVFIDDISLPEINCWGDQVWVDVLHYYYFLINRYMVLKDYK